MNQHIQTAITEEISGMPAVGSVPEYKLPNYGPFKQGSEAMMYGRHVRVLSLTNIPGGVSASVEVIVPKAGQQNAWQCAACNLKPVKGTPEAIWYEERGIPF